MTNRKRTSRFTTALTLTLTCLSPALVAQQAQAGSEGKAKNAGSPEADLVYALYVMRHGVRSPTADPAQYDRFSSAPWPKWTVLPGELTPHGFQLIKLLGAYDREALASHGLLANKGCEDVSHISIHADSDQRTRETARAMSEGMFPGCNIPIREKAEGENDPVFHLPEGSVSTGQAKLGAAAILGRIGGDPANTARAYAGQLTRFDDSLAHCGAASPRDGRISILSMPATVAAGSGDRIAEVKGPISTAGTLSEILLLEYAEGMPANNVGWGCADGPKIRQFIDLHTAASELFLRTPAVAIPQSRGLLQVIRASLDQAATRHAVPEAEGKPGDKLLLLVGHDTNLTNLAGALQLDWLLDGRRNDTPPGSALVFQLWRDRKTGAQSIRLVFTAQTLEQMRNAESLDLHHAPPQTTVFIPACSREDSTCTAAAFSQLLSATAGK